MAGEWPPREARFDRLVGDVTVAPFIAADAAYPLLHCVIPPYKGVPQTTQDIFNYCHSSVRMRAEHVMGRVKGRFRTLLRKQQMQSERHVVLIIACCFILHNVCLDDGDDGEQYMVSGDDCDADDAGEEGDCEISEMRATHASSHGVGVSIREALREHCADLALRGEITMSTKSAARRTSNNETVF